MRTIDITTATTSDLVDVARLFRAYAASLPVSLAYQNFDAELATLPGAYAPPSGALLIARLADGAAVGCVGLRPIAPGVCEMKRLYVDAAARGSGAGGLLVDRVMSLARDLGYREMRLDTLPTMATAQALYAARGFEPCAPYYETPVAGTVFLSCLLHRALLA
jgi:GNAT superfamily N-acetyltransferase